MHLVLKGKQEGKAVVVAGCVPQADRHIKGLEDVSIVGIQQVDRVVEVVEETLKGHTVRLLSKERLPELDLPKIRKNPMVEIIPLSTGCLGACTYCKTRHARGKLGSYTPEAIVSRAQRVIGEGVTEIWLSSEDTGAYGIDLGTNLPILLNKLIEVTPEGVMLRVGMTNPPYILDHLEAIADVLNHEKVYAFLHVPVQSGSNDVLLGMNREYTVEEFSRVADYLLEHVPGLTLATDIICGFPGETEKHFDETMELVEKYRFHIMNISQFYPRPGTPAAKMKRVPTQIVKNRSRRITKLFDSFDPYPLLVGTIQKVWINTEVSDDQKYTVGHTKNYTKVLLERDDLLMGSMVDVKITSSARFHVIGEIMTSSSCRYKCVTPEAQVIRDQIIDPQTKRKKLMLPQFLSVTSVKATSAAASCGGDGGCGTCMEEEKEPEDEAATGTGTCSSSGCCGGGDNCGTSSSTRSDKLEKQVAIQTDFVGTVHHLVDSVFTIVIDSVKEDRIKQVAFATAVGSTVLVFSRLLWLSRK
jgi:threonylcarbamoyladenosine tRNA methylthiotransferase CDKAL1